MAVTYWDADSYLPVTDLDTVTGDAGDTWTAHGDDIVIGVTGTQTLRTELANAIANQTVSLDVTVTPYPPKRPSPPHIYLEPDGPFFEFGSLGAYVWAYKTVIVVPAHHQASWDWMERLAPLLVTACASVPGARFEVMDQPDETEVNDRRYLVAEAHITIKRARS